MGTRLRGCDNARSVIHFLSGLFVFIWATGFITAGIVSGRADPLTFLAARHACSIVVFTVLSLAVRAAWPRDWKTWRNALFTGMLLHGFYLGGVFWAVSQGLAEIGRASCRERVLYTV